MDGLLAWLPLTDDLRDHGPQQLPVKVAGSVQAMDGATRFPGSGNHLELPHINLKHREFAIAFWVNVTGEENGYVFVDQAGMDRCWQRLQVHLRADFQPFFGFYVDDLVAPSSLPSRGGWHHLVFQYVNRRQQIWMDGRLLAERVSPPLESRFAPTFVGRTPGWGGLHDLEGWMRDLRIYGRALPATEIGKLSDRAALLADLARRAAGNPSGAGGLSRAATSPATEAAALNAVEIRPMLSMVGNQLTISGPPVQIYDLQATPALDQAWQSLQVLTNFTGSVGYLDEDFRHLGERFFRVKLLEYRPAASAR
ncbi:MAG TPA: hypothetical protein DCY13_23970 [Verrucomicrobiales bacterium]|nr:hypothetical protein [Verrucomicrobiales bacterium]